VACNYQTSEIVEKATTADARNARVKAQFHECMVTQLNQLERWRSPNTNLGLVRIIVDSCWSYLSARNKLDILRYILLFS